MPKLRGFSLAFSQNRIWLHSILSNKGFETPTEDSYPELGSGGAHLCPSTQEAEGVDPCGFEDSMVCRGSSRTARATQKTVKKKKKDKNREKEGRKKIQEKKQGF